MFAQPRERVPVLAMRVAPKNCRGWQALEPLMGIWQDFYRRDQFGATKSRRPRQTRQGRRAGYCDAAGKSRVRSAQVKKLLLLKFPKSASFE